MQLWTSVQLSGYLNSCASHTSVVPPPFHCHGWKSFPILMPRFSTSLSIQLYIPQSTVSFIKNAPHSYCDHHWKFPVSYHLVRSSCLCFSSMHFFSMPFQPQPLLFQGHLVFILHLLRRLLIQKFYFTMPKFLDIQLRFHRVHLILYALQTDLLPSTPVSLFRINNHKRAILTGTF